ncbi:hypothetical protein CCP4SC76_3480001 [Gammaproteobacteria bacterium]
MSFTNKQTEYDNGCRDGNVEAERGCAGGAGADVVRAILCGGQDGGDRRRVGKVAFLASPGRYGDGG